MGWLKLDDKFARHPKVAGLSDRSFRVHVSAMLYAAEYKTEGLVPRAALPSIGAGKATVFQLVSAGLWHGTEGGYLIHDFDHYNPKDPTNAARQRRYRNANRNGESNGEGNENRNVTPHAQADARARPVPSKKENLLVVSEGEKEDAPMSNSEHPVLDSGQVKGIIEERFGKGRAA